MSDPMRDVASATWRSVGRASRGVIVGSMTAWDLVLVCGHTATRYDRQGGLRKPKRARCRLCALALARGETP